MSKWSDDFEANFKTTKKVREVKENMEIARDHREMNKILSEVIKGKWQRKGKFK